MIPFGLKKGDLWIVCILLVLSGLILSAPLFLERGQAVVYLDGKVYARYALTNTQPQIIRVESEFGSNVLEISRDGVRVMESSCEDGLEVKAGRINKPGQSLVCLPNRLVITIEGRGGYDGVSY